MRKTLIIEDFELDRSININSVIIFLDEQKKSNSSHPFIYITSSINFMSSDSTYDDDAL